MSNPNIKFFTYKAEDSQSLKLLMFLVNKTLELNKKCLITCPSNQVEPLDDIFWTRSLWLPHGKVGTKNHELQPVLIGSEFTRVNEPDFLFLFNKLVDFEIESFERVFIIYKAEIEQSLKDFLQSLLNKENIIFEHYGYKNGKYEKINII